VNDVAKLSVELLTIADVSALLQVPEKTLRQWVFKGSIPNIKLNGLLRFDRIEIQKWVQISSRIDVGKCNGELDMIIDRPCSLKTYRKSERPRRHSSQYRKGEINVCSSV